MYSGGPFANTSLSQGGTLKATSPFGSNLGVTTFGGGRPTVPTPFSHYGSQTYNPDLTQISGATQTWSESQAPLFGFSEKPFNQLPETLEPSALINRGFQQAQQQGVRPRITQTQAKVWDTLLNNPEYQQFSAYSDFLQTANRPAQRAPQATFAQLPKGETPRPVQGLAPEEEEEEQVGANPFFNISAPGQQASSTLGSYNPFESVQTEVLPASTGFGQSFTGQPQGTSGLSELPFSGVSTVPFASRGNAYPQRRQSANNIGGMRQNGWANNGGLRQAGIARTPSGNMNRTPSGNFQRRNSGSQRRNYAYNQLDQQGRNQFQGGRGFQQQTGGFQGQGAFRPRTNVGQW